jgi:hypothetical protein
VRGVRAVFVTYLVVIALGVLYAVLIGLGHR